MNSKQQLILEKIIKKKMVLEFLREKKIQEQIKQGSSKKKKSLGQKWIVKKEQRKNLIKGVIKERKIIDLKSIEKNNIIFYINLYQDVLKKTGVVNSLENEYKVYLNIKINEVIGKHLLERNFNDITMAQDYFQDLMKKIEIYRSDIIFREIINEIEAEIRKLDSDCP